MSKRIAVFLGCGLVLSAMLVGGASAGSSSAKAKTVKFTATLGTAQEVPKEKGAPKTAGGTFSATLTGTTLKWQLNFGHLSSKATAAHIHVGPKGKSGPVVVALCGPCQAVTGGSVRISPTVIKKLENGGAYVNVHTTKNPNGEIRGQVSESK